ncbi:RNA polymerase sigma factor [Streptomyces cucumeris]|uniref:RNA polymerase sigma factor n=1 Tax=Streptomyces cucumeris TaxID=2962890 RepID=UPI003D716B1E
MPNNPTEDDGSPEAISRSVPVAVRRVLPGRRGHARESCANLDDGVQEVRLKLLEQCADPGRAAVRDPSAWSSVVAARVAADWHRAGARDNGLRARLAARWARQPAAGHTEEDRTLALAVADGLGSLPRHQRQLLTLRYYADLPVRDIAQLLGIPEGTVKSRLHTAVAALRNRLHETEVIHGDQTDRD